MMKQVLGAAVCVLMASGSAKAADDFALADMFHDGEGNLKLTADVDYRAKWPTLGTWAVDLNGDGKVNEMHWVYASPGSVEYFRANGTFADGTVLIKELHAVKTEKKTTGYPAFSDENFAMFLMIKDDKGRYPDKEHWTKGWAWGFFEPDEPDTNAMPVAKCIECHTPAKDNDWAYIEGYPALRGPAIQ